MPNIPLLQPANQFPTQAIEESVQELPKPGELQTTPSFFLTFQLASSADAIVPWGPNTFVRDRQLREFWPSEPNLAGAITNVCLRNSALDFVVKHRSSRVETAVTDMLKSALGPPGQVGWASKETAISEDYYTTDNGAFEEIIREPTMDANSKFKGEKAPVLGIAHLDSGKCLRTGDPEYPVIFTDRKGVQHKLKWYEVIPFCEMPSPISTMNGVGLSAVSRVLRASQIMKSISILTDEMVSGRNFKKINIVGGVSRSDVEDARKRGQEQADNLGHVRYIEHLILCGLDPEKPVSVATIDLAGFPTDFNYDIYMKWYISTLALGLATDYQELAPLPGGNLGSSAQSEILNKKSRAKGLMTYMRSKVEAYKIYGVLPRDAEMVYEDRNQAEELEKQEIRTKALEEAAISVRGGILPPGKIRQDLVRRGIYDKDAIEGVSEDYGNDIVAPKQSVGPTGGNTIAEDAARVETGRPNQRVGDRLQKEREADRQNVWEIVKAALSFGRKPIIVKSENQPAQVKVDVHNHPGKPPVVNVTNVEKEQKAPVVNVRVPRQAAPIVNVTTPEVKVNNTVNVPEMKIPAPVVNVAAPNVQVNLPEPKPKSVEIQYDAQGKPIGLKPKQ